jgi:hypothetical protein
MLDQISYIEQYTHDIIMTTMLIGQISVSYHFFLVYNPLLNLPNFSSPLIPGVRKTSDLTQNPQSLPFLLVYTLIVYIHSNKTIDSVFVRCISHNWQAFDDKAAFRDI